jgi:GAF domain-containing protein
MTDHLSAVIAATGQPGQPAPLFAALDLALAVTVGHILFTVLRADRAQGYSQRVHSNMPDAYPVGGRKPITDSAWFANVLDQGNAWIGADYAAIRDAFFDHELIRSLGCESCLNVPVRWNGRSLGTLNLLHREGHYRQQHVPVVARFAALAVPALLDT